MLQGLERLCALNSPSEDDFGKTTSRIGWVFRDEFHPENIRTRGMQGNVSIRADTSEGASVSISLTPPAPVLTNGSYSIVLAGPGGREDGATFPADFSEKRELWNHHRLKQLGHAAYFQLDPFVLRTPSYSQQTPTLGPRGEYLASVLANIAATDRDLLEQIERDVREVVPQCRRIRTPHASVTQVEPRTVTIDGQTSVTLQNRTYGGHRLEVEVVGAGYLGADLLSEGTLIVLALLTALHTAPERKVFLLDDIERALHPSAQRELVAALRRFLAKRPDAQILCTSHSPYIIDHFAADEVCVMQADGHGHATCRRLSDHPEWLAWKGKLEPGEFWTSVGESWVEGY